MLPSLFESVTESTVICSPRQLSSGKRDGMFQSLKLNSMLLNGLNATISISSVCVSSMNMLQVSLSLVYSVPSKAILAIYKYPPDAVSVYSTDM